MATTTNLLDGQAPGIPADLRPIEGSDFDEQVAFLNAAREHHPWGMGDMGPVLLRHADVATLLHSSDFDQVGMALLEFNGVPAPRNGAVRETIKVLDGHAAGFLERHRCHMTGHDSSLPATEPTAKRVRVIFNEQTIADSIDVRMVWEHPYYPQYYFPMADVVADALVAGETTSTDAALGPATHFTVTVGDREAVDAAWQYADAPVEELREMIRFDWAAMDRWYEEGEEVFIHARNPYSRIDVLESDRHVQVEIDGVIVADSRRPKLLFETGLPTRYYLPHDDVRRELLTATDTTTPCPYKGVASYWTATVDDAEHRNVVWSYPTPLLDVIKIAGLLCFYNEKVDIIVDGERQ